MNKVWAAGELRRGFYEVTYDRRLNSPSTGEV
jgi:hypothetical protein